MTIQIILRFTTSFQPFEFLTESGFGAICSEWFSSLVLFLTFSQVGKHRKKRSLSYFEQYFWLSTRAEYIAGVLGFCKRILSLKSLAWVEPFCISSCLWWCAAAESRTKVSGSHVSVDRLRVVRYLLSPQNNYTAYNKTGGLCLK